MFDFPDPFLPTADKASVRTRKGGIIFHPELQTRRRKYIRIMLTPSAKGSKTVLSLYVLNPSTITCFMNIAPYLCATGDAHGTKLSVASWTC